MLFMTDVKKVCYRQFFRDKSFLSYYNSSLNGNVDCSNCSYDPENNEKCPLYRPMFLRNFEVKDNGGLEKKSKE
jgi:hypothetical protein